MYEGDVVYHLKATDLSYVLIAITFVSYFISLLERHTNWSVQIEMAKETPDFEGREKMKK
jgi:hypothetical protein